jgi:hypothetical protein
MEADRSGVAGEWHRWASQTPSTRPQSAGIGVVGTQAFPSIPLVRQGRDIIPLKIKQYVYVGIVGKLYSDFLSTAQVKQGLGVIRITTR